MSFLIYKKTPAGANVRYERIRPLKLSGPDGLIARHVKSLADNQIPNWQLDAAALLKMTESGGEPFTVLFNVAGDDATAVCFYELARIHGSCRETSTELALDFNVVLDGKLETPQPELSAVFEAPCTTMPKKIAELLALTGGPGGGDWKWGHSAMQLGATVVRPSCDGPSCGCCNQSGKAA